jgi:acyl-coenzyme A thioesterase PaaI-like protein
MQKTLKVYKRLAQFPLGKRIFSKMVCVLTPYFSSIKPVITELDQGYCSVSMRKRRAVTNHINTVHAIAMCNMAELSGGLLTEVSLPKGTRWLPSGMSVKYLKKAKTNLTAIADGRDINWDEEGDKVVPVQIKDINDEIVFTAQINMNIKKL